MTCRVGPAAWPMRGRAAVDSRAMKHFCLAATLLLATCVLPGEPSSADRVVFSLPFAQPYRVPIGSPDSMRAHPVFPEIGATANGEPLDNPRYRLESDNTTIVRVDSSGQGLQGVARGLAHVRIVLATALGAPDTTFEVQVVVSHVTIDAATRILTKLDQKAQLTAFASDAGYRPVPGVTFTWASSRPGVATISSAGVVAAVDEGNAVITAQADDVSGTVDLTVVQAAARVQVSPKLDTLRTSGRDRQFQAFAYDSTASRMLPVKILWRSTNPAVATVDAQGLAIARSAGTARIVAQVGSAADTATLVLKQVLAFVVVNPGLDTMTAIDDSTRFVAQALDSAQIGIPDLPSVTWTTADPTIATVDQTGLVRARANGLVLITAAGAGQSGSAVVLVRQEVSKAKILEDTLLLTGDGATARLHAMGVDKNGYAVPGAGTRFSWGSQLGLVATVDTGGLVTAHGDGRTRIQALPINGGQSDTATVIVTGAPQNLIAFDSPRGIEVVRADGTLRTVLVNGYSGDYYYDAYTPQDPAWSPDGTRLAFALQYVSYYYANAWSIDVSSADGSIMTEPVSDYLFKGGPAWSPDGKTIAFSWDGAGGSAIYIVPAAGGSSTRLTDAITLDYKPAWSPDGTKIAFQSERDGNNEIYMMNADGSGVTRLTNDPGQDIEPAWSPDASQLAFSSTRRGSRDIWLMNADGSNLSLTVAGSAASAVSPAWSPDGAQIVFASLCSRCTPLTSDLYIINRDGTGLRRLTTDAGAGHPSWRVTTPLVAPLAGAAAAPRRRRGPTR